MIEFIVGSIIGLVFGALTTVYLWGAGLILLLAGSSWFTGASTVGAILLGIGAFLTLIVALLWGGSIAAKLID